MTTATPHRHTEGPDAAAAAGQEFIRRAPLPIFGKAFTDGWRAIIGWAVGFAAAVFLYLPLFPTMSVATIFGLIGFALISIAAIGWGAAALGGDEESGQLELTLAHGVTRTEVAVQRFAAMSLKIILVSAVVFLLVLAVNGPAELDLNVLYLFQTSVIFAGLALLSGSAAMFFGAVSGRKVWGIGGGAFVAVVGYVLNAIGNQSADVEWLHALSPYYWAYGNNPLANGADWLTMVAFFGGSLLVGAATAMVLRRRDIGV
ncbi:ABC transporter permease [Cryobacterium sp. PH31-AA6]|uniref:ABC transporter permease subunit n=1 Tax=Cryobacterium sp. PH31-AA6 TaxID=3046205 RepID=UPI0024B9CACB|nr:ABC transporter permease subunit [Cryobacterium sp. PH31-AA6]MDJ0325325.1 ABC transporter permease [Cryobacterium sp. PH31-AA6]